MEKSVLAVLIAEQTVGLQRRDMADRRLVAQAPIEGVGILLNFAQRGIELDTAHDWAGHSALAIGELVAE